VAYTTNESGLYQVVVQTFPDPNGGKWPITAKGGFEPKWRQDGRELYYLDPGGKLMVVSINTDHGFSAGESKVLFQTPLVPAAIPGTRYDVTADGQRFLMIASINSTGGESSSTAPNPTPITVIVNWTAMLRKVK
jgi:hypothetical protein